MAEDNFKDLIEKLQSKKKEIDRFIEKYKTRKMNELEEYYKGASWAFEYTIKVIKDTMK